MIEEGSNSPTHGGLMCTAYFLLEINQFFLLAGDQSAMNHKDSKKTKIFLIHFKNIIPKSYGKD